MTVAELIEQLQRLDPRASVVLVSAIDGRGGQLAGTEIAACYRVKIADHLGVNHERDVWRLLPLGHRKATVGMVEAVGIDDRIRDLGGGR